MLLAHGNHSHGHEQKTVKPSANTNSHSTNNHPSQSSDIKTEVKPQLSTLTIQLNDSPSTSSVNTLPGIGELTFLMIVITPIFLTLIKKHLK